MASYYQRKKVVSLSDADIENINYQNIDLLKEFVMETGRILPSRITGTKARYQRLISN